MKKLFLALMLIVSSLCMDYVMKYDCPGSSFLLACEVTDYSGLYSVYCQCFLKGFERDIPPTMKVYRECSRMDQFPRCYHNNAFSPEILCNCYNA